MTPIIESQPLFTVGKTPYDWHIKKEELQKCKLLVGGPCQDNNLRFTTSKSDHKLMDLLCQLRIPGALGDFGNESCVPRGRNTMAATCMKDGYTHFLSRDADIEYDPWDVVKLLAMNLHASCVIYPYKGINWTKCFLYCQEHQKRLQNLKPEELAEELEAHSLDYVVNMPKKPERCNGGIEINECGGGFLMFKRAAFQRMIDMGLSPKMNNPTSPDLLDFYYGHYNEMVVAQRHLTEDWAVAWRWRQCGGKVYALPVAKLNHMGSYNFKGGMPLAGL